MLASLVRHIFPKVVLPVLVLGSLLLASCGPKAAPALAVPAGAQADDLVGLKECEYQSPNGKRIYEAECATLVVPENRENADSRLIALPVVRIPARTQDEAEPVFLLIGGPGAPNLSWEPPDWLLTKHDAIMVGYRGAEGSVVLDCPEMAPAYKAHVGKDILSQQSLKDSLEAERRCVTSLQQAGVDLGGYTIAEVIEDHEAVRIALGYERVNLLSESYGTRIAQIYAYMYPESLHRAALLGVNTPGGFIWRPEDFDLMLEHMSELCAQDEACSSRTDDLAQAMYEVTHNMPSRWLFFPIDPDTVRVGTHSMFFRNPQMPMVLDAYLAAAEGDPSGLAMMNLLAMVMPAPKLLGDLFSKAMSADLDKYGGIESVSLGDSILGAPMSETVWPLAEEWPMPMMPKELRDFQESDVEMLLVNGTIDFSTPPGALDEARAYYHNAQMVLLPEFSHVGDLWGLQQQALERLITSYYDTGAADASLYVYEPLSFEAGTSLVTMAKVLVASMIFVLAIVVLVVVLVIRRVRRGGASKS